jgi:predicted dithiol-disulfide oxidoreductase (DUF899 family)
VNGEALRATNGHCRHRPAVIRWRGKEVTFDAIANKDNPKPRKQVPNTYASEIGPMSGSHNTDDLVNDMLADMCDLIVKTMALIPPDRDDHRLSACAFVLEQINEAVNRVVNANRTEH